MGVTEGNNALLYRHVKEFYQSSGDGAELWVWGVAASTTMAAMLDVTKTHAPKLLDAAKGKVRLLAVSSKPKTSETLSGGLSNEVDAAVAMGQTLADRYTSRQQPLQVVVDGKAYSGTAGDLKDYKTDDKNRCSILLSGTVAGNKNASVGLLLGKLAAIPVQRNIARVKDGSQPIQTAVFTDGTSVESHLSAWESIHDKGYIFLRSYVGRAGYFFSDDPTTTSNSSDLASLARNRVIDKARRVAYEVYVEEIGDEVEIDPKTGYIAAVRIKALQVAIESRIQNQMIAEEELAGVVCRIDEKQNIQASGKIQVELRIVPLGYFKEIVVNLGFAKSV